MLLPVCAGGAGSLSLSLAPRACTIIGRDPGGLRVLLGGCEASGATV